MPRGIYIRTAETKLKMSLSHKGIMPKCVTRKYLTKEEYRKAGVKLRKEKRHSLGISKRYREDIKGFPKKYHRQKRKALQKGGGELTVVTIQQIYEDNIKRFGTLTCYLCLKPILLGKDHLEHKTPLSRGGTNNYCNLAIACDKCNLNKHNKTEAEYRKDKIA